MLNNCTERETVRGLFECCGREKVLASTRSCNWKDNIKKQYKKQGFIIPDKNKAEGVGGGRTRIVVYASHEVGAEEFCLGADYRY